LTAELNSDATYLEIEMNCGKVIGSYFRYNLYVNGTTPFALYERQLESNEDAI